MVCPDCHERYSRLASTQTESFFVDSFDVKKQILGKAQGLQKASDMQNRLPTIVRTVVASLIFPLTVQCQNALPGDATQHETVQKNGDVTSDMPEEQSKHVLWVIPNFRTSPTFEEYTAISPKEKFTIAAQDSFDRGTVALSAVFAGEGQLTNGTRSFGQGTAGYARYFGTAYADFVIGNYMTEAIFPTILHQDPRYFRKGTGSRWSRLAYSMGQIFWTHKDSGGTEFNYSEIIGNSTAVAISNAYYPDNRTFSNAISKLGVQISVDMAANVAKEFWPDIARKFARKHHPESKY